jgi:hypothetical protein
VSMPTAIAAIKHLVEDADPPFGAIEQHRLRFDAFSDLCRRPDDVVSAARLRSLRVRGGLLILLLWLSAGCATVHQEDLDAWEGQPVSVLDKYPVFLTMRSVRTVTADGTEIRNYVNGAAVTSCGGGGDVFSGSVNSATYDQFSSCVARTAACNGIFYIKNGIVQKVTAIGTGGMRCYTDFRTRPDFSGSTNIY